MEATQKKWLLTYILPAEVPNEIKLLPCHRDNAYKHGGIILRGSRRRNFDERQKMLISTPRLRASLLTEADVLA